MALKINIRIDMKYDNEQIITAYKSGENLDFLFFWGHRPSETIGKSCLSQWYVSTFEVDGVKFNTAEHYMMAKKALLFNDKDAYEKILKSSNPKQAKQLGRQVKNFDSQTWEDHRFEIVVNANFHKFSQQPTLSNFLINTNNRILVEASPLDKIWGIGLDQNHVNAQNPVLWDGLNLLGYALMETRDLLMK